MNNGIRSKTENGEVVLSAVYPGGAAHGAGLSAGDVLLALDGLRITPANIDGLLAQNALATRSRYMLSGATN